MDILDFGGDLLAVVFPVANKVRLALGALQHRHDLKGRQGPQIRWRETPPIQRMREHYAGAVAVEPFPLPSREHVSTSAHSVRVPKKFASHSYFMRLTARRGVK